MKWIVTALVTRITIASIVSTLLQSQFPTTLAPSSLRYPLPLLPMPLLLLTLPSSMTIPSWPLSLTWSLHRLPSKSFPLSPPRTATSSLTLSSTISSHSSQTLLRFSRSKMTPPLLWLLGYNKSSTSSSSRSSPLLPGVSRFLSSQSPSSLSLLFLPLSSFYSLLSPLSSLPLFSPPTPLTFLLLFSLSAISSSQLLP